VSKPWARSGTSEWGRRCDITIANVEQPQCRVSDLAQPWAWPGIPSRHSGTRRLALRSDPSPRPRLRRVAPCGRVWLVPHRMNRISEHIGRNGLRAAYFSAPCSQTALQFDEQLLSRSDAENFYRLSGLIQRSRLRPTGLPKGRHGECLSSGGPRPEDYCWRRKRARPPRCPDIEI
jgi:hypothetical protein